MNSNYLFRTNKSPQSQIRWFPFLTCSKKQLSTEQAEMGGVLQINEGSLAVDLHLVIRENM